MTHDSPSPICQAQLTDALLWLVGTPLALLDALYLAYFAPPVTAQRPETLVVWALGVLALVLLAWNLLCSMCAHLALVRVAPPVARRAAKALVARFGTRLSRSLLAKAGAGALIGSVLVTSSPVSAALALPHDAEAAGVSLTWADTPTLGHANADRPRQSPPAPPSASSPALDEQEEEAAPPRLPSTVTVAAGDSLWSIAASLMPDAEDARIDAAWRAIHAANSHTVADPSRIYPGQRLTIPQDLP